jgi:threonylcarbamoyladenosine tRNA methylthiotransferase MtaB
MLATLYTLGCKVNFADGAQIETQLKEAGFDIVRFGEPADLVVINTCTVTMQADADSRKMIRRALRRYPNAFIAVTGCFAQLRREELLEIDGVDAVFGQDEKFRITEILSDIENTHPMTSRHRMSSITLIPSIHRMSNKNTLFFIKEATPCEFHASSSTESSLRTRIVLKLQDGCDYRCAYCAVPDARGSSRSMNFDDIEPAVRKIANDKFVEIILTGINLGEYRSPSGERFVDVVRLLTSLDIQARFRISSIEPNLLTEEIINLVADSKNFCPHFHIPLQSGSDTILSAMRRRYRSADFENLVSKIKDKIPDCCIGVDLIAGFPGETEQDFVTTYKLIERLPVSYLHAFTYSVRQGTPAAEITPKVAHQIKKERTIALRQLSDSKLSVFYQSQIGKTRLVVPETLDEVSGLWHGWSENYVRCEFELDESEQKSKHQMTLIKVNGDKVFCRK